jgi:glycerol-3-phosphate dehydrogenase
MTTKVSDVEDLAGSAAYDVAIIGAGCVGANVARELSKFDGLKVIVIEQESDVAQGASKANSGIVHGGYDAKGKWKGRFEREGNEMFDVLCRDLAVPFKRIGSLVLSFTERD